jgi:hypothetical protein
MRDFDGKQFASLKLSIRNSIISCVCACELPHWQHFAHLWVQVRSTIGAILC